MEETNSREEKNTGDKEVTIKSSEKSEVNEAGNTQGSIRSLNTHGKSVTYTEMSEKGAVKNTRKKIEKDIQLLKNRVRMLQKEKEKADKKIVQTKAKAEEILARKKENDKLYHKKLKEKEKFKKAELERRKKFKEERKERARKIEMRKYEVYAMRKEEAKEFK